MSPSQLLVVPAFNPHHHRRQHRLHHRTLRAPAVHHPLATPHHHPRRCREHLRFQELVIVLDIVTALTSRPPSPALLQNCGRSCAAPMPSSSRYVQPSPCAPCSPRPPIPTLPHMPQRSSSIHTLLTSLASCTHYWIGIIHTLLASYTHH